MQVGKPKVKFQNIYICYIHKLFNVLIITA